MHALPYKPTAESAAVRKFPKLPDPRPFRGGEESMSSKTIALGGAAIGGLVSLAVLPALLAASVAAPFPGCGATIGGPVEVIMATIRQLESGGDYTARAPGSSASGAYQFIDGSWAGYGGYPRAWLAPPDVQDAKAADYIAKVLAANSDDVSLVPVAWYIGHVPPPGSAEWDIVPAPGAGNRLTPREYQTKWMDVYRAKLAEHSGTPPTSEGATGTTTPPPACVGGHGTPLPGGWSLPGPRDIVERTADQLDNPHHDYPAWDWGIPTGTPVYAVRGGNVVSLTTTPYNCAGRTSCDDCGLGVTVADEQGVQWTYCHGSAHNVRQGDAVTAGQQILTSGNTGNSTGSHLHLAIRTNGIARCPQPLLVSLYEDGVGLDPNSLPTSGCSY